MVAELRDLSPAAVLACVARAPLSFFPRARQSGDYWRVPEQDVRALLGDVEPAVSARTFAGWLDVSERVVSDACRSGALRSVMLPSALTGKRRIPQSELYRVLHTSTDKPRRRSFFAKGVQA